jgi:Rad3-related DNA helicase
VCELISTFVSCQTGNYVVYFPSYKYMQDVYTDFTEQYPGIDAVIQQPNLSEEQREDFLSSFRESPETTYVAFCVQGGIFAEGIDLKGSRLIGAVVVSVGLPQLSLPQDIIRDYFTQSTGMGYEYAYMYPGMNKVLQAAGRVIRSESDQGAILLIDERYSHRNYLKLYPRHWRSYWKVRNPASIQQILQTFWGAAMVKKFD